MTGDEAYHADCFRCIQCNAKIDDLVFAKTSQGIYCMRCHQERKDAKRRREERERMERAERLMEKLLPSIPEAEKRLGEPNTSRTPTHPLSSNSNSNSSHHHTNDSSGLFDQSPDMPRLPFSKGLWSDHSGAIKSNKVTPSPRTNLKANEEPSTVDVGPPFLPPLTFGLDNISTSSFDMGDMLGGSETEAKEAGPDPPTPPSKDAEIVKSLQINSFRASLIQPSVRLSIASARAASPSSENRLPSSLSHSPLNGSEPDISGQAEAEAEVMVRELRMELAKYNPMSPLLHGTPQQEFGLLLEKNKKLSQEHAELEKSIRDMYIEKDMLGMDLEAMNEELKAKEESLVNGSNKQQSLPVQNPRMSTNHEFMKQAYLVEVKALQEQKEKLQKEIRLFMEQREAILNEMQILSVRNAELSTINNDMIKEMQGRMDPKPASATSNNVLQSWSEKIRRQRQLSGGNQQDLKNNRLLESNESTHSFNSTLSDDNTKGRHTGEYALQRTRLEDRGEEFYIEEMATPRKFNWKKGTTNTVKTVGAMFGKLLVEGQNSNLEVPNSRNGQMQSDSVGPNGLNLPASRTFSNSSETRSLNGKYTEQHQFIQHNFVRPTRCEYCDDKVWGREYRCRNCGFHIHGRCTNEIVPGCPGHQDSDSSSIRNVTSSGGSGEGVPPPPPNKRVMFGTDLLEQLELEQRIVPLVVEKCIEAVDERGLDVEGIYRRSGMAAEAKQLVQAYDIGLQPDLMDSTIYQDICSITSVLKQYLRSLPEPLVPYDMYADFMEAIGLPENETKAQIFRGLMERMPLAHYRTMKFLLEHLNRVTSCDDVNLMNAKNLSVVFGPTLMRNPDPSKEIMDMTFKNMTIEYFINHTSELFIRPEQSLANSIDVERTSTSSIQERPSTSSTNTSASSVSNTPSSSGNQQGSNSSSGHLSPPPRRMPTANTNTNANASANTNANGGSPSLNGLPNLPLQPQRSTLGESIPNTSTGQSQSPPLPSLPQAYVPTSQYRPQTPQHQTLQQLHQKQQQIQQQQQSLPGIHGPAPLSSTATPYSYKYPMTPHQQMANPEVDMTNFP
ncbi:hypothetical protein BGX26_004281 [Mortierella sp. AD094]|nr:hypothetical protein BGX26_004281 [Mortierella sp. AD094]